MGCAFFPWDALAFAAVRVPELSVAVVVAAFLSLAKLAFATGLVPFVAGEIKACLLVVSSSAVDTVANADAVYSVPVVGCVANLVKVVAVAISVPVHAWWAVQWVQVPLAVINIEPVTFVSSELVSAWEAACTAACVFIPVETSFASSSGL